MCLAVPMKLVVREGESGVCDSAGVHLKVSLVFTPEAKLGDFLIVHAGYALSVMSESEAMQTMDLLRQMQEKQS